MECAGICYWEPSVSLCVGTNDSEEGKEWAKFQVASAICIANSARDGSGCTGAFDYASCMLALHARLQQSHNSELVYALHGPWKSLLQPMPHQYYGIGGEILRF